MCRFILIVSIRRREYAGHHSQGTEGCGDHVAHDITIIVLQSPYKATFTPDDSGYSIVNEGIEVFDALVLKLFLILFVIDFLESELERLIVLLTYGIFCTEPKILLCRKSIIEAGSGKGRN